jgi:hypothetical protein
MPQRKGAESCRTLLALCSFRPKIRELVRLFLRMSAETCGNMGASLWRAREQCVYGRNQDGVRAMEVEQIGENDDVVSLAGTPRVCSGGYGKLTPAEAAIRQTHKSGATLAPHSYPQHRTVHPGDTR